MKRFFLLRATTIVLLVALCLGGMIPAFAEGANKLALDLVIVVDQSTSMYDDKDNRGNDKKGYRLDAAAIMLGMCDMEDSRAAIILFNGKIIKNKDYINQFFDISMLGGNNHRTNMIRLLTDRYLNGDTRGNTDLGLALKTAVDLIEENPSARQPVVLLLTDGDFDMRGDNKNADRTEKISREDFDQAVARAANSNIKLYTIHLAGSSINETDHLLRAAAETGGLFREVRSAEELPKVFNDMFANEIHSEVITLQGRPSERNAGWRVIDVPLPNASVAEANIMVHTTGQSNLYKPNSNTVVKTDNEKVFKFTTRHFTMYKIVNPTDIGTWQLEYESETGESEVGINVVFSYELTPELVLKPQENLSKTDSTTATLRFIKADGRPTTDKHLYLARPDSEGIVATLIFAGTDGTIYRNDLVMDKHEDRFEKTIDLTALDGMLLSSGEYRVSVKLQGDGMNMNSKEVPLEIVNRAPAVIGTADEFSDVSIHDPRTDDDADYEREAKIAVDLNQKFIEPEGEPLVFTLERMGNSACDAYIDGHTLYFSTLNANAEDRLTVRAQDPDGAQTSLDFPVKVVSVRDDIARECRVDVTAEPVGSDSFRKNGEALITAQLLYGDTPIKDAELLKRLEVRLDVSGMTLEPALNPETGLFEAQMTLAPVSAEYRVTAEVSVRDIDIDSGETAFSVGNLPPALSEETLAQLPTSFAIEPFLWRQLNETDYTLDIPSFFTDTVGDNLSYQIYEIPETLVAAYPVRTADEWMADAEALAELVSYTPEDEWTLHNDRAMVRTLLMTAADSDGERVGFLYRAEICSQKDAIVKMLLLIAAGVALVIVLIVLCYWLIYRKSWSRKFGTVQRVLNGAEMKAVSLPVRSKREITLGQILQPSSLADNHSTIYTDLSRLGSACKLRAKGGNAVEIRLCGTLPAGYTVKVGAVPLKGKKGNRLSWAANGKLSIDANGVSVQLIRTAAASAATRPAAGGVAKRPSI